MVYLANKAVMQTLDNILLLFKMFCVGTEHNRIVQLSVLT